jgi:putative addiction module killer protein
MIEIIQSSTFSQWLGGLRDRHARMRIHARLDRLALGHFGDVHPVGHGLSDENYRQGLEGLNYG